MDVIVARAADDHGRAVSSGHDFDPLGCRAFPIGLEFLEGSYVVHLDVLV